MTIARKVSRGFRAGAGALALAGLGFGSPALACDPGEHQSRTEKVIVLGDHRDGGEGERRIRTIRIPGDTALAECDGERIAVDESTGGDRERTKVLVCGKGDLTNAERAEKLERALARIDADDDLSAEHKAKVTSALRAAIERLRSAH